MSCSACTLGALVFAAPEGGPWDAGNMRYRYWRLAVAAAQRCALHPSLPETVEKDRLAVSVCECRSWLHAAPRFHDLRHSRVAYLIAASWDFYMIQLRLGHASIKTTFDIYGHLLPHGERDRLQALDGRLPTPPIGKSVRRSTSLRRSRRRFD